jgi:uncharacterized membrane protein (UPF0127 family)
MKAVNLNNGNELATNVIVADTLFARMKGLLGKAELRNGEALWIKPCFSVHTFFMKFPIDVLFLNKKNQVIAAVSNLTPNRMTRLYPQSFSVLELPSGTIVASNTEVGDEIEIA